MPACGGASPGPAPSGNLASRQNREDTLPLTAQECRARAIECNERGAGTRDFGMKIQYQQLAERWQSLADQLERDEHLELAGSDWNATNARTPSHRGRS
jgi:hypothetical protein